MIRFIIIKILFLGGVLVILFCLIDYVCYIILYLVGKKLINDIIWVMCILCGLKIIWFMI